MYIFPDAPGALYLEQGDGTHTETKLEYGDLITYKPETGIAVERDIDGTRTRLLFRFPGNDEHVRRWPVDAETAREGALDLFVLDYVQGNGLDVAEQTDEWSWVVVTRKASSL